MMRLMGWRNTREIAGALGMTKGALYKHYKNKRDIFDHILIRMEQRDAEQAGNCEMPEGTLGEMEERYQSLTFCNSIFDTLHQTTVIGLIISCIHTVI